MIGAIIAVSILVVLGYLILQDMGLPMANLGYEIKLLLQNFNTRSTMIILCIIIGGVICYFLYFRKE